MKREELEVLIGKYLDGTIEPIELELLLAEVRANEESGKLLARHSYHERTIADLLAVVPASPRTTRRFRRTRRSVQAARSDSPTRALLLAVGALAAAFLLLIVYSASSERREEPRRATAKGPQAPEIEKPAAPPQTPEPRSAIVPEKPKTPAPIEPPAIPLPPPKPAPRVEPPPPPPPPAPRESVVAAADLERVEGDVTIGGKPAKAGEVLPVGRRLEVVGARGLARLKFSDGTWLEAQGGTSIREITEDKGRRVHVDRGAITAEVARQPADRPMVFVTPHGDCTVLGTTLRIVAAAGAEGSTRVEVEKGKVRLTRTADKKTVEIVTGFFAVAAPTGELTAKPIPKPETVVLFEFEDGARPAGLSRFDGEVVRGPSNRFCVAGAERRDTQGNYGRYVRIQRDSGLVKYSDDLELRYDIWMSKQTSDLRIHLWNRTQEALLFATLPMVKEKQWVSIAIRLSDLRDGDIRFREGDVVGIIELVANVDPRGGEGFFDNVRVVRLRR